MTTFKRFEADDIVKANPSEVTTGLWPNDTGSLTTFFTGSQALASESGQYYWNVYNTNPNTDQTSQVCFAVAYGHRTGGGHPTLNDDDSSLLATKAVYSQYRNLLLDPSDTTFTFNNGSSTIDSDHIYVINVQRALLRERLDPGNWSLSLTGTNGRFTFIDDSGQALGVAFGRSGLVFNVVSGSLSGSAGSTIVASGSATKGGYGLFYPSLGIIVLNPNAISESVGFSTVGTYSGSTPFAPDTGSKTTPQYIHAGLFFAIKSGSDFQARSAENISSTHYFVRLRAKDFNYSNNPTYFDETDGTLTHTTFIQDPKTYPTTVGLYNDANELLAVAKLSQPVQKGFDKEVNVKVRLDF